MQHVEYLTHQSPQLAFVSALTITVLVTNLVVGCSVVVIKTVEILTSAIANHSTKSREIPLRSLSL